MALKNKKHKKIKAGRKKSAPGAVKKPHTVIKRGKGPKKPSKRARKKTFKKQARTKPPRRATLLKPASASDRKSPAQKPVIPSKPISVKFKDDFKKKNIKKADEKNKLPPKLYDGVHQTKIRIIGIGGGGGTIVSEIAARIKRSDFYIANTDGKALLGTTQGVKKFQFGIGLTHGLGTGMNAELGERAAKEEEEKIKSIFEGQDLCILIACLGGGTSSGSAPIFAKISKNLGNLTFGIFTMPFEFEGEKKMQTAIEGLEKIKPNLDIYAVIPNERIFQIVDKNTPLKDAFFDINKRLADNIEGLIETIYTPGLINIDFADLKTIISGKGRLAYLNSTEIEGATSEEVAEKIISSPVYPYTIRGAKGALYNIVSGRNIQLSEISQISSIVSEAVNKQAKIIFGINQNPRYKNKVKITLLATGCANKDFLPQLNSGMEKEKEQSGNQKRKLAGRKPERKTGKGGVAKNQKKKTNFKIQTLRKQKISLPKSAGEISAAGENKNKVAAEPTPQGPLAQNQKTLSKPKETSQKTLQNARTENLPARQNQAQPINKITAIPVTESRKTNTSTAAQSPSRRVNWTDTSGKVRKSGLQVKKEVEEAEKELTEQEKIWEIPAYLRRKNNDNEQ